jgi:hypothetical protein
MSDIFKCAARYTEILQQVTSMVHDLTLTLSRLDRYIKLFPDNRLFQSTLHNLYEEYTGFCVDTVIFLKKWPLCTST